MTKAELQKEWETRIDEYRASGQSVKELYPARFKKHKNYFHLSPIDTTKHVFYNESI
jgi:hypothetical protein